VAEPNVEQNVERITRRYQGLNPQETAIRLKENYSRKREAIQRFTDRLEKSGGFVDDAEVETLRNVGVSEEEIKALVEQYGA
jgi:alkylhydroperoxidase family enzyme